MRRVVVALIVMSALAGCADAGPAAAEPEIFQEVQATADTGVIRGVVVDDAITPVPGATVTGTPGGFSTTTDDDGAFVFSDLEPGVYFLEATAPDHEKTQTSVEVVAGVEKPAITRMMMAFQPPPVPYIQALTTNMLMSYSVSVAGSGVVVGPSSGESFFADLSLDANTTLLHSELVWRYDHPLADTMQLRVDYSDVRHDTIGQSPLIDHMGPEDVETASESVDYTLFVEDSSLAPVGFTTDQRLVLYTFGFHLFLPQEGWSFERDGPHPIPS